MTMTFSPLGPMAWKPSLMVCEKEWSDVFPLGKSSLFKSASLHTHRLPFASVAVPWPWMVEPICVPPLASSVVRITTVRTPVPVRAPADGGVNGQTGNAGTVRSTANLSCVAPAEALAVNVDSEGLAEGNELGLVRLPLHDAVASPSPHKSVNIACRRPKTAFMWCLLLIPGGRNGQARHGGVRCTIRARAGGLHSVGGHSSRQAADPSRKINDETTKLRGTHGGSVCDWSVSDVASGDGVFSFCRLDPRSGPWRASPRL